jgi:hypothetical protein
MRIHNKPYTLNTGSCTIGYACCCAVGLCVYLVIV